MIRIIVTNALLCLIIPYSVYSQTLSAKEYQNKYPGEPAVYLIKRQTYKMDLIKDTLSVTSQHYDECFFLDGNAKNHANKKIYSGSLNPVSDIKAETKSLVDGKYKSYPVKEIASSAALNSGVFYDELKEFEFVYPQLQAGSITSLSYGVKYLLPQLITPYYFASQYPCEVSELVLECHNAIVFDTLLFNVSSSQIQYTQVKKGNYTTHTWRMKNIPGMVYEHKSQDVSYYSPQLYLKIDKINLAKGNKVYFENQQSLYDWLYTFVDKVQKEKDQSIQKLSDSLKLVSSNDYELSKNIFYWVQNNINYVAFENGYGGFIPRYASDVYNKRYGDCKDMANLISQIHKSAGLDAHIAWIGTRDIPYKITTMPSPCNFNHMIAAITLKDSTYFLDATGKYQPYGFPTDHIQGKQALISLTDKKFTIVEVPVLPMNRNLFFDSITCTISNGALQGKGFRTLDGYPKIDFTYLYAGSHKEEKVQVLNSYLKLGNNKCKVSDAVVTNVENKDKKTAFSYQFSLPDYMVSYEDEIFINLHMYKVYNTEIIDTLTRKLNFTRDHTTLLNEVIVFEIPSDYKLKNVPKNKSYNYAKAGFNFTYQVNGNKVTLTKSIYIDSLLIEKKYFKEWNTMIAELNKAYKENIALVKTTKK